MRKAISFIVLLIGSLLLFGVSYGKEKAKDELLVPAKRLGVAGREKRIELRGWHVTSQDQPSRIVFPEHTGGVFAPDGSPLSGFMRGVQFSPEYLSRIESSRIKTNRTISGLFLSSNTPLEAQNLSTKIPPLSAVRITGEVLAGSAVGFGLGYLAASLGSDPYESIVYWMGGHLLGSPLGVYLVGNTGDETGSFRAALIGSFAGWLTSFALGASAPIYAKLGEEGLITLMFVLPPVGATGVFNSSRKYK